MRRALPLLLATTAVALSGCAAAIVPVLAGGAIIKKRTDKAKGPSETDSPAQAELAKVSQDIPPNAPAPEGAGLVAPELSDTMPMVANSQPAVPAIVPALPIPAEATQGPVDDHTATHAYTDFVAYSLQQMRLHGQGKLRHSQVLAPGFTLDAPRFLECRKLPPSVLIDLDPANGEALSVTKASPGLLAGMESLRKAKLSIVWITDQPLEKIGILRNILRESGLDRVGQDPIFTRSRAAGRKQETRLAVAQEFCIVAMSGDARTDMDELFAFLKSPESAAALQSKWGAGWFLVPLPMAEPSPLSLPPKENDVQGN